MATQVTNYQCPACTGPLHFSAETGKLECEYCDSSFDVAQIEELYAMQEERAAQAMENAPQQPWDTSALGEDWGDDATNLRQYSCPSCGAQLICDDTTAATQCPYCGNPTVVPGQFSGALRPEYVIPFAVTRDHAIRAMKDHFKGKILLPSAFTRESTIEKIQGVYVPFWLFDGSIDGDFLYKASNTRSFTSGDNRVTETSHYLVRRGGSVAFEKVPVDASTKMPDEYMDSIEPFDYSAMVPFSSAYLPGFLADKYDVTAQESMPRADERCENTLQDAIESTLIMYQTRILQDRQVRLHRGQVHYALLPVWLLNVKWQDQTYLFAVNGQTGRTAGALPCSFRRAAALFAAIAAPLSILGCLLAQLITG